MENVIRTIKVICIINIICSLPLFIRNRKVLDVDRTNRTVIQQNLERNWIEDTGFIKKISLDRKFNNNVLYIQYWYGRVDSEVMLDGFSTTEEWSRVWENAYQERDRGFLVGGTSVAILIILKSFKKEGQSI